MNELFCIECGKMVHVERGAVLEHRVTVKTYNRGGDVGDRYDIESCYFPLGYTFVAPPAAEPDWIDSVVEQGIDELEVDLDAFAPHETFELMREVVEV